MYSDTMVNEKHIGDYITTLLII